MRRLFLLPLTLAAAAQVNPASQQLAPAAVPYASVSQLNVLLSQLEQAAQSSQADLAKLRIDRWKADSGYKRQSQANVESITRNLQTALPEIVGQLRASPEDLTATFKLYRNLDALYDVFGSLVESAGAFGSKDEFQTLENDLSALERARHSLAERMETLSVSKEAELNRLRVALRTAQAAANPPQPKKVIVDDTEAPKKPTRKKSAAKTSKPSAPPQQPPPTQPQ